MAIGNWLVRTLVTGGTLIVASGIAASDDDHRVYTEHPRLFLTAQRLRLLKRERERESPRWRQFDSVVKGGAVLPEPGFALALYYAVSGDGAVGKRAVDWALGQGADVRQLALVYDWCRPMLSEAQSAALAAKIRRLLKSTGDDTLAGQRDRALYLIATADSADHPEEAALGGLIQKWWHGTFAPDLANGRIEPPLGDFYALIEMMHAIRDNLKIDLREDAPEYFTHLPTLMIVGQYPAPYKTAENDVRIPLYQGDGPPDLNRAALARAAGLSMVAYDNNALENQFLQGWLIHDRFSMMTPFGAPYEFLWANPYQPGLSYFQLPLVYHDANTGVLFARSSWDDDADWFGLYGGAAEVFQDGRADRFSAGAPLHLGDATVIAGHLPMKFQTGGTVLIVGLKPNAKYLVETDDEELREITTDRVGTLVLEYPADRKAGVRVHEP